MLKITPAQVEQARARDRADFRDVFWDHLEKFWPAYAARLLQAGEREPLYNRFVEAAAQLGFTTRGQVIRYLDLTAATDGRLHGLFDGWADAMLKDRGEPAGQRLALVADRVKAALADAAGREETRRAYGGEGR